MSKTVLKAEMAPKRVLEYTPPKFELDSPDQAKAYLEGKRAAASDFRMSDVIRVQTGVSKIEASNVEDDVERKVLERLKQVQESAYQEAYNLGLEEGKHEAFQKTSSEINASIAEMTSLIESIKDLKKILVEHNESHIVQLAFHIAKRLAHVEVQADPKIVLDVIRASVEKAQIEEEITIQVARSQVEFLEKLKTQTGRDFEFLKHVKLEGSDSIMPGGCIIGTNYGEIDARFEERVDSLWKTLSETLHRVKNKISTE